MQLGFGLFPLSSLVARIFEVREIEKLRQDLVADLRREGDGDHHHGYLQNQDGCLGKREEKDQVLLS